MKKVNVGGGSTSKSWSVSNGPLGATRHLLSVSQPHECVKENPPSMENTYNTLYLENSAKYRGYVAVIVTGKSNTGFTLVRKFATLNDLVAVILHYFTGFASFEDHG